jgi:hypothetical protein
LEGQPGEVNEGFVETEVAGEKNVPARTQQPGCQDCLMEHCTGASTLYRTDNKPVDFSFIFKDDVIVKKDDPGEDKEAPIDPENVNNPMEPIRIEERIRKKKTRRKPKLTRPGMEQALPEDYASPYSRQTEDKVAQPPRPPIPSSPLPWKAKGFMGRSKASTCTQSLPPLRSALWRGSTRSRPGSRRPQCLSERPSTDTRRKAAIA